MQNHWHHYFHEIKYSISYLHNDNYHFHPISTASPTIRMTGWDWPYMCNFLPKICALCRQPADLLLEMSNFGIRVLRLCPCFVSVFMSSICVHDGAFSWLFFKANKSYCISCEPMLHKYEIPTTREFEHSAYLLDPVCVFPTHISYEPWVNKSWGLEFMSWTTHWQP